MRRNTRREKRQKKTIFLSILGIVVLLFLLFKYGLPILINFSLFIAGNRDLVISNEQSSPLYISPPIFDSFPIATNSAEIEIKGTAEKEAKVEIFLNGKKIDEVSSDENGKFLLDVRLKEGENIFTARQTVKDKKSDFSTSNTVIFKKSAPTIEIISPSEGASFKKEDKFVEVKGKTDSDVSVTVNGFFAVINESNEFFYSLGLNEGENEIKVAAVDLAGNRSEKAIKVNYSP